jgi:DNA-binding phage protein
VADPESDPASGRMAVFAAVVAVQDDGFSVEKARSLVARRFGLSEIAVKAIEREGLDNLWPPLGEP